MVFSPYPDFGFIFNSHDLSLSQRLVIPSDYRTYYPTPHPQTAVLRKPEGNFWTVKWTISQEETISFEDGWSKFVTDNAPIDGDYLLFTYDGCRSFWVRIYRNGLVVEPKSPVKIQEISDDEDARSGDDDHDMEKAEDSQNMVISLSLGSSDEDNAETSLAEVNKAPGQKGGPWSWQKKCAQTVGDPEIYLDDPKNPCFFASSSRRHSLPIGMQVIRDYDLKFGGTINFIDEFGEEEAKVGGWRDRVVVNNWYKILKRNDAKPKDIIICEILREGGVVQSIKPHFVKK